MRIGDLAHETGVNRRLLRYYEEQGLLRPVRLTNGYREYTEADIATVRNIRALLAAGLPTAVIARGLHCVQGGDELLVPSDCPTFIEDLRRERAHLAKMITRLQSSQEMLDAILDAAPRQAADVRPKPAGHVAR
ncbi:MerR family transcriptional regulator [Nonomuraea cavernae]|uniref:MerR family transcriptional regulator n=1 Tax=Nonomuraea cavernae TaxID=2045107 RepID=A0A917ZKB0_9ACTN|nr:MerR family transcriptional regulator [Nonomuraea cavernae]MCA2189503.1 MerR family transcriptional regulator [Nonomuraea cavernae]GGO83544.1 MerR family transcriptional regulator [Nonomuraea cavernae]